MLTSSTIFFFLDDQVKPLNHSHELPPPGKKGRTYICSCMIFLRPSSGAKLVMKKWIEELQAQPWSKAKKANDQPAFNWALNKTAGEVCPLLCSIVTFLVCYMTRTSQKKK
jgi:rhamnogalacturonan II specific xylosyltransferase